MDELLGKYYQIIIEHFSNYLKNMDFKENKETGELLNQLLYLHDEDIDSQRIIFHHGDLLDLKSKKNFLVNVICLLFELHLFYSEEILNSIENLEQHESLDKKSKDYLLFVKKVLDVDYSEDDEVIENFMELLKVMPEDYEVVRLLWSGYYGERNNDILLEMVKLADKNDPFNNSIMHFKAFMWKEMGQFENALNVYTLILKHDREINNSPQKIAWGFLFLADCYLKLDNIPETIRNCNESFSYIKENKDDDLYVLLHNLRGEAYLQKDDLESAICSFEDTLKIDENNLVAKQFLEDIKK